MSRLRHLLEESHKDLHQWFLLHQECLLLQRDDEALQAFSAFSVFLREHLNFENTWLLPAMQVMQVELRWPLTVYEKEHEKLLHKLERQNNALAQYLEMQGRRRRLALLSLLDLEQSLYHVMEHHEQREEKDLFNHLQQLDGEVTAVWEALEVQLLDHYGPLKEQLKAMLENA